jgi:adenylosuccinate lyase
MAICPIEFRYGRKEMKEIFDEEYRLQRLLDVEAALSKAHTIVGNIQKKYTDEISKKANIKYVKIHRVKEIESEIKHDVMAVVKALSEQCSKDAAKYIHLGATSNDITDTAAALQMSRAVDILRKDIISLEETLLKLARRHRKTIMLGRTHGQAGVPITFGLKLAVYLLEMHRHLERLDECKRRLCVGKMMGAVGTGAALGKNAITIQKLVMKQLGLGVEEGSTQIIQRDRYIEFISVLCNIATSAEKFATEIRNLQRSEIAEVSEGFDVKKQIGSSTMPHKRNPIKCENICSLARIIRGFMTPTYENAIMWHERDLTNSAGERFIIPHACILTDDILQNMRTVFENLIVYPENMKTNINKEHGLMMAESVMIALVNNGLGRQDAHELVRNCAMTAESKHKQLREILIRNPAIKKKLTIKELDAALEPANYLGSTEEIISNIEKIVKNDIHSF